MSDEQIVKKRPKPVVLVVFDGWGVTQDYAGNAITQADTPVVNMLTSEYPSTVLQASGEAVGLPWGEPGNSEVGHLSLGLGRVLYQELPRINRAINDGSFVNNKTLLQAIDNVKKNDSALHFMGLLSDGGVHSSVEHLYNLLKFAKEKKVKRVYVHAILDGRDTALNSGKGFVTSLGRFMLDNNLGEIATLSGRFFTMDRNNNWDRTEKGYQAIVYGVGDQTSDPVEAISKSYKNKIFDEEFIPTVVVKNGEPVGRVKDGDSIVFFNYRPDRARQITKAFVLPEFDKFERGDFLANLFYATFTEYEKDLPVHVIFPPEVITNSLGEVLSKNGLKQLRIAETEKYAHVTYFFNGGLENPLPGEDHVLVPSPMVDSYDKKPEMSAFEINKKLLEAIDTDKYDFILVNFANADMVGHTGNIEAAVVAVEAIDKCLGKIVKKVLSKDGVLLLTADHGNAENMFNMQTGQIDKEHTSNPVPFVMVGNKYAGQNFNWESSVGNDLSLINSQGILPDVALTILKIMNIKPPKEMTGVSLI